MKSSINKFASLMERQVIFQVPEYQRNYSWDESQLSDLWEDLVFLESNRRHYFGTVILRGNQRTTLGQMPLDVYHIIDGQQRMVSLMILLNGIIKNLDAVLTTPEKSQIDLERIKINYLKVNSDTYKVELLGDDRLFFKDNIMGDQSPQCEQISASQKRLSYAKQFFNKKLGEAKHSQGREFKKFLFTLLDNIKRLEYTEYEVDNLGDAALIFETVNDRGKPLSSMEKTKSFLMHMLYLADTESQQENVPSIGERFKRIYDKTELITKKLRDEYGIKQITEDDIQRYHFIFFDKENKGKEEYDYLRRIKNEHRLLYKSSKPACKDAVLAYSQSLEQAFIALHDIINHTRSPDLKEWIERVFRLGQPGYFYPLMIACWIKLPDQYEEIKKLFGLLERFSFRVYAVGGLRADKGSTQLYRLAFNFFNSEITYEQLLSSLKDLITEHSNDRVFKDNLKSTSFYGSGSKNIRYLFFFYEKYLRAATREHVPLILKEILGKDFTVEHIWAQSEQLASARLRELHADNVDKLGNLALADKSWNSQWGDKPYKIKARRYSGSAYLCQKKIPSFAPSRRWGQQEIINRETAIIEFVLENWRV